MKAETKSSYDVIVVGGGLGGLTAANRLAKEGYSVLIAEQHSKVGGYATWFKRGRQHTFDVSMHGFPSHLKKSLEINWNAELAGSLTRLEKVVFDNPQFKIETSYDEKDYKRILKEQFNIPEEQSEGFFEALREHYAADSKIESFKVVFNKFFPGRNDVLRFILEPISYANGFDLDDPAHAFSLIFLRFMQDGVFSFKINTKKIIGLMVEELKKSSVDIMTKARVEKIVVADGQARGVLINGKSIAAQAVISNADLFKTVYDLTGRDNFDTAFLDQVEKTRPSSSNCQVYIGIKEEVSIPYVGDMIFTSEKYVFDVDELLKPGTTSMCLSFYYSGYREGSSDTVIVATINALWQDWATLSKKAYDEEKEKLIRRVLQVLKKYIPDIESKIDYVEAATPKTFQRYAGHQRGATFGTKFEGLEVSRLLPQYIKGLFYIGSVGIIMSSWLGVINNGSISSYFIKKYLRRKARLEVRK
ncbi:MAG: NAD(P)/FAD-dependent oxidoreductase [Candidatus Omnitrophica bacterium]|nr:NAD(P)/FAD-dependent oxidoreductase [Candidatus Omnitrophota bacterium]